MIKTILFDFGNVIAFFDHGKAVARLARFTDMAPVELALVLYGSPIEDAYERGCISTAEYIREGCLNGRLSCADDEFLVAFIDIFWRNDEVCDLVPRLHAAGYQLLLASNTNDAHFTHYTQQFADILKAGYFSALCTSHHAGARKPAPQFFTHCQRHVRARRDECLFIDDLPVNVEAAEQFGWKGLVYRADGTLAQKLRDAGIEISKT